MDNNLLVSIIVALIGCGGGIVSAIISAKTTADKVANELKVSQAVTNTKIETLTAEVQRHNNFATRIPVLENQIQTLERKIEQIERGDR